MRELFMFTAKINIYFAVEEDIEYILDLENKAENRDFVWQGTYEQHMAEIEDSDTYLLIVTNKEDEEVGYTLLNLDTYSQKLELRRIVMDVKGNGYGRETIIALLKFFFNEDEVNKFWLDVYPDNKVGVRLYESLGFVREGILRENYKTDRGILDQAIYSILRNEYFER